jgi:hypothetical protein
MKRRTVLKTIPALAALRTDKDYASAWSIRFTTAF